VVTEAGLQAQWQERLDTGFPKGMVAQWMDDYGRLDGWGNRAAFYMVPWVQVTGLKGTDPVVTFADLGVEGKSLVNVQVISYEELQHSPLLVRVKFAGDPGTMLWISDISAELAARMASQRQHRMSLAAHA
jgi:hypothetical protein